MKDHDFMEKPIPNLKGFRSGKYSCINCQIQPSNEKCVKLNHDILHLSYYWDYVPRPPGALEHIFLRETLNKKLFAMDRFLFSLGFRLFVQEGFRPIEIQRFVEEFSVLKFLRKENPNLTEAELREKAKLFIASTNRNLISFPPPHLTGGAVDVKLIYTDGSEVDMGKRMGLFNTSFPDALEYLGDEFDQARKFRRLLFWLARENGFMVNPTEWWHLSYGDQMWASLAGMPYAIYGVAENFE